jgi:hypothetical protein
VQLQALFLLGTVRGEGTSPAMVPVLPSEVPQECRRGRLKKGCMLLLMGERLVSITEGMYGWIKWWVSYSVNSIWEGYATFPDADIFIAVQLLPSVDCSGGFIRMLVSSDVQHT